VKKVEFKVKLEGMAGSEVAAVVAPFDVKEVFGTKARVPVRGTINGVEYRSSLMPMGGCHRMVVNRELREAGRVRTRNLRHPAALGVAATRAKSNAGRVRRWPLSL